ncbi:O-antigen/teichoic acid export membrane protein [Alkalihalobacillus xiaoxiensis]|uniref:O-antigen/teichoic acid export membrane protein n=1 Tax=Shouchella xiaoxiensis TaxID=766895 RepID=A0ABS2SSB1_9BACI|nr:polysaccharide biosynthesis protein [Shouchella xiaoxiensis]MBM7838399.1 O-antigen/teichoic acid export membrane protein [Shouchella xiaoxiensis]
MADTKLMQGTKALTLATLTSKTLGFIYIIPFLPLVGEQGIALYQNGYMPYMIMLTLATMGVPVALSKFVSKYHALGDYETAHRLFKSGIPLMLLTGVLAYLFMFFSAPLLANLSYEPSPNDQYTYENVVFVIRMVGVALLIIPVMALMRGYLQGFRQMVPTSISQVVEQVVRIVFILVAAFLIMRGGSGNMPLAVGFATFGAFVGGFGGLAVLIWYYLKQRKSILERVERSKQENRSKQSLPKMYKELVSYALPLSFVGLSIPLFQNIDVYTIEGAMAAANLEEMAKPFVAVLTGMAHKIVLIPMALATALSITLVPTITRAYTAGDTLKLQNYITQTYQVIIFITVPASIGMSILAEPIYYFLFGAEESFQLGVETLRYYAPITLFFAIYAVTGSILQGMNRQKNAVISLIVALILKLSLTYLFIVWFGPFGAIWTTYIGFAAGIAMNVYAIGKYAQFNYTVVYRRTILIGMFTLLMAIAVWIVSAGFDIWLPELSRVGMFIPLLINVAVGVIVYFYLAIRSHLAGKVLGDRFKI